MVKIVNGKRVLAVPWSENTSGPATEQRQVSWTSWNSTTPTTPTTSTTSTTTTWAGDNKRVLNIPKQATQDTTDTTNTINTATPTTPTTPTTSTTSTVPATKQAQPIELDYETADLDRQKEIVDHLNYYAQANPASMRDVATFRSNYNYDKRSSTQKTVLDNRYFWYNEWRTLSQQPIQSLTQGYLNKAITQQQLDNLKSYDSSKYQQVMDNVNKWQVLLQYKNELNPQTINPFQSIIDTYTTQLQKLSTIPSLYDQYKNSINSPELTTQRNNITNYQTQIDEIDDQLNNLRKDIERRYEWSGATNSAINAIYSDEANELMVQKNNLARQMGAESTNYNWQLQAIWQELELQQQDYQMQQQALSTQMQQLGMIQSLVSFQTPQQKADMERDQYIRQQEYIEWNIYSNDPATRKRAVSNAVDNVLKEFSDIPMYRSREQMIQDIQNLVDNWTDLGTAITKNLRDPIMQKPEYQNWLRQKFPSEIMTIGDMPYQYDNNGNLSPMNILTQSPWTWMTGQWLKNNNPWNIKDTSFGNVIWVGKNNMAQFATPEDWFDALVEKIKFNQTNKSSKYYWTTIAQYFEKYAPSNDGNNPQAYASSVAKNLWVSVNTKISNLDPIKFAAQIAKHDSWYNYSTYWQFRNSWSIGWVWATEWATVWTTAWEWWQQYNDIAIWMFKEYAKDKKSIWKTKDEIQANLKAMWFWSTAEFQVAANKRAENQATEQPQLVKDAANYILENPLFDTTIDGVAKKGILGAWWLLDRSVVNKIDWNMAAGRNIFEWVSLLYQSATDTKRLTKFVNSLQTLRSSWVVDIIKWWTVKLYPMSDSDVALLWSSIWLSLWQFIDWQNTMSAISNMYKAMTNWSPSWTSQTSQIPWTSWYDMSWIWWYSSNNSNNSNSSNSSNNIDISYWLQ